MAITIDLPPQMAEEAKGYATLQGTTLEQMFLQLLKRRRLASPLVGRRDPRRRALRFALSRANCCARPSMGESHPVSPNNH